VIETPAVLTDTGDIRLHNREGCRIPMFFQDDAGNDRVMTGLVVAFLTEHDTRIELLPGVATNELVLMIAPGAFSAYIGQKFSFVVRDESVAEMPVVWRGDVIVEGW
jgi:hypothetical protein